MDKLKLAELEGHQQRLMLWVERIRECRASNQTVTEWSRQNGFSPKAYYYWMRKIKRELVDALPEDNKCQPSSIIPLEKSMPPKGWAICESQEVSLNESVIVEIGKCRVTVTPEHDAELLSKVLKVLVAL